MNDADQKPKICQAIIPFIMLTLVTIACGIPQDCMGITINVAGYVLDENNHPLPNATIRAWNKEEFGATPFDMQATSDASGYFETDRAFTFECIEFHVEIAADGYEPVIRSYYPPSASGDWGLRDKITINLQPLSK